MKLMVKINNRGKKLSKAQIRWLRTTRQLSFQEMNMLMEYYVLGVSMPDIAERYKITLERVRQINIQALKKITLFSK